MLPIMEATTTSSFIAMVGRAIEKSDDILRMKFRNSEALDILDYPILDVEGYDLTTIARLNASDWIALVKHNQYRLTYFGYKIYLANSVDTGSEDSNYSNKLYFDLLQQGSIVWNKWRQSNWEHQIDFSNVDFRLLDKPLSNFDDIEFGCVDFSGARFASQTSFKRCAFFHWTDFTGAHFGDDVSFDHSLFAPDVIFEPAIFGKRCSFRNVSFDRLGIFRGSIFGDGSSFENATFEEYGVFDQCTFGDHASFANAKFGDHGVFHECVFGSYANFSEAEFDMYANFIKARFGDNASFKKARFGLLGMFEDVEFGENSDFNGSNFGKALSVDIRI